MGRWVVWGGIEPTSAGEEMKNNKVVVLGEEKLYISAAKLETFTFSLSAVADRFLRGERKNDPSTPRSRLTTIPHLFYSYKRVISTSLSEVVYLPKMYTYIYIEYTIILAIQWPRAISNIPYCSTQARRCMFIIIIIYV